MRGYILPLPRKGSDENSTTEPPMCCPRKGSNTRGMSVPVPPGILSAFTSKFLTPLLCFAPLQDPMVYMNDKSPLVSPQGKSLPFTQGLGRPCVPWVPSFTSSSLQAASCLWSRSPYSLHMVIFLNFPASHTCKPCLDLPKGSQLSSPMTIIKGEGGVQKGEGSGSPQSHLYDVLSFPFFLDPREGGRLQ